MVTLSASLSLVVHLLTDIQRDRQIDRQIDFLSHLSSPPLHCNFEYSLIYLVLVLHLYFVHFVLFDRQKAHELSVYSECK